MNKLKLNDLLRLSQDQLSNTRIRMNRYNGWDDPISIFKRDPKELLGWNYWNSQSYKKGQISVGLVDMHGGDWLLFTVGVITKVLDKPKDYHGVQVEFETQSQYEDLFGRVVVHYENKTRQMFRTADSIINELIIKEILPSFYTGFDFPGYDKVCLPFKDLKTIVNGDYPSYKNALENQKAVYVITDKSNGKLYVGSATAQYGMLLSRWSSYASNGHGGNVELRKIVNAKGIQYVIDNFQYSIIENFNSKVDDSYVLDRESYWKKVLDTKIPHGYNDN